MTDAQIIGDLEARRVAAMLAGDVGALIELLSPDVRWIHSSGAQDSRDSLLARIGSGQFKYLSIEASGVETRRDGNLGTATGRVDIVASLSGNVLNSALFYVVTWASEAGTWQLIHLQSTSVKA